MRSSLFLLFAVFAAVNCEPDWSNKINWSDLKSKTGVVTIDRVVVLNQNIDVTGINITSTGALTFSTSIDINLNATWILVNEGGYFDVGTPAQPYKKNAVITLRGRDDGTDVVPGSSAGTKFIMAYGGTVRMAGTTRTPYAQIVGNIYAGDSSLVLDQCVDWVVGDKLVLLTSDRTFFQTENITVTYTDGCGKIGFYPAAKYFHYGQRDQIEGNWINEAAEVMLLTHNIVIQGDEESDQTFYGAQVRAQSGGKLQISGVEFRRVGQQITNDGSALLGRYPYHLHMIEEAGYGCYINFSSIHHTFSRCVTLHNTHGARVHGNVMYNHTGHCLFMEDGIESGNVVTNNIIAGGLTAAKPLISFEGPNTDHGNNLHTVASYWIVNANNTFQHNRAAGSDWGAFGFWIQIEPAVTGPSAGLARYAGYNPARDSKQPDSDAFYGNIVHSYGVGPNGFLFAPEANCGVFFSTVTGQWDNWVPFVFRSLFVYKSYIGVWSFTISEPVFDRCLFVDNVMSLFQKGIVTDSVFIKRSLNPILSQPVQDYAHYNALILYDGEYHVSNSTFIDYSNWNYSVDAAPYNAPNAFYNMTVPCFDRNVSAQVFLGAQAPVCGYGNSWTGNQQVGWVIRGRIHHDCDTTFTDCKFVRSIPEAGAGRFRIDFNGTNRDHHGNLLTGIIVGDRPAITGDGSCKCEMIWNSYNTCYCPTTTTTAKISQTCWYNPASNEVKEQTQSLGGGVITREDGLATATTTWVAPNGGYAGEDTLVGFHGYYFAASEKGLECPARMWVLSGNAPQWIKFATYYPYTPVNLLDYYNKLSNNVTWLASLDDLNSKTDLNWYAFHDINTGIIYQHLDPSVVKNVMFCGVGELCNGDPATSPQYFAPRYTPASPAGDNVLTYPSFAGAHKSVAFQASYDLGTNQANNDYSNYYTYIGSTYKGRSKDPTDNQPKTPQDCPTLYCSKGSDSRSDEANDATLIVASVLVTIVALLF